MTYRKYNCTTDTNIILDLHQKVFKESNILPPPIERLIKMEGTIVEDNNKPIAYLLYSTNISIKRNNNLWLYLEYIGVIPTYRHRGLGRILIEVFIENLDKNNIPSYLDVEENSDHTDKLIKWYEKYGYRITEEQQTSKYEIITMTRMERKTDNLIF